MMGVFADATAGAAECTDVRRKESCDGPLDCMRSSVEGASGAARSAEIVENRMVAKRQSGRLMSLDMTDGRAEASIGGKSREGGVR